MDVSTQPPSARQPSPSASTYGLIEEEYANEPFYLLVVCIFLNKTKGERAIPQARKFIKAYPSPEKLSKADIADVRVYFAHLGLKKRAEWLIPLAQQWIDKPPKPNDIFPKTRKHKLVCKSEVAHLTGVGRYASDAWRIFCKDKLFQEAGFEITQPEWKKVIPSDNELSKYLVWRWRKEGYIWNPVTGDRTQERPVLVAEIDDLTVRFNQQARLKPSRSPSPVFLPFPGGKVEIPQKILASAESLQ